MFMDNILKRKPSYYMDGIKEGDAEEDNFAFFYNCFEEIKEHEEVKNVVINLCNNGGGDCVLGTFVDAYGHCAAFSGMLKIGRETESGFVSDEKATTLDYDMLPSLLDVHLVPWYDADGIAEAVHRYQSGETAADYSEEEEEQITGFLEMLLETMNASSEQASESAAAQ